MGGKSQQPVFKCAEQRHEPGLHSAHGRQPAAREHVAVSCTEFHYCVAGDFPLSELRRKENPCQIHLSLKSECLQVTLLPRAGLCAMANSCPSARTRPSFLFLAPPMAVTARVILLFLTSRVQRRYRPARAQA